jgi:rfaE bifunctional protein nucleotidyltransferase chain/domain
LIVSLQDARAIREKARADGRLVVVANGAFDLLHVGHVRYLRGAKDLVRPFGLLIVGVNTDKSVRASKGPFRPLVPEADRAELVASLACVDLVVLFDEATAEALLEALAPDLHAKGTDYTPETVPERELVERLGGRTVITGDPKEHSTTDILARLKGSL